MAADLTEPAWRPPGLLICRRPCMRPSETGYGVSRRCRRPPHACAEKNASEGCGFSLSLSYLYRRKPKPAALQLAAEGGLQWPPNRRYRQYPIRGAADRRPTPWCHPIYPDAAGQPTDFRQTLTTPQPGVKVCADCGYDTTSTRWSLNSASRRSSPAGTEHGYGPRELRWAVDQSFALLHWFRRVCSEIRDDIDGALIKSVVF